MIKGASKITIVLAAIIIFGYIFVFVSSGRDSAGPRDERLSVIASIYPLAYLIQEIGDTRVSVHTIVPAGVEPHEYELTPRDMAALERSDLIVLSGTGFEPWAERIQAYAGETIPIVQAGEGLALLALETGAHTEPADPHLWLSPVRMGHMAARIRDGLILADPAHADVYRINTDLLLAELAALDAEFRTGLAHCSRREIVVSHAAFGYLAHEYDLAQVALAGLSPEEEPSAQAMAEVVEFAREHGATHIFFETLMPADFSETIAREMGAETLVLNPLEGLTPVQVNAGSTYITEMRKNLSNLKIALACR